MWIKALLAVVPAALFIAAPAPVVHADGACTALGSDYDAYNECISKKNVYCTGSPRGYVMGTNLTCTYPDGGRDECVVQRWNSYSACTYFAPGSEPAPGAAPELAADPVPPQP